MMKKNSLKLFGMIVLLTVAAGILLAACASTVRLQVQRTPTMDTAGIRRISVMPFNSISGHADSREMAQYVTAEAIRRIQSLNHFTLVDSSVIEQLRRRNESIEGHVDALFTGQITRIDVNDSSRQREVTDRNTGVTSTVITYTREAVIEFTYYFTRARDGSMIGPVTKRDTIGYSSTDFNELPAPISLLRRAVDNQVRNIGRDIAPYTISESRRLAREPSKDKELRALMKDAESQVKARNYRIALESYLGIYGQYRNFAAALNASILHEALGETQLAANLMQRASNDTGNPRAQTELARLNRIISDQVRIASEFGDSNNPLERVTAHASNEIRNVLPQNARVWIFNSAANDAMITAAVDNITADFIRRGIGVVDRDHSLLISAEQNYQLSGFVSDDYFVSVGNAAGANIIAVIGITGTGAMRRMQVRVLDVERGVPIFQSDTNEAWGL